ncbi:hypothetical protein B0J13DRAFT_132401 [Dactylonectria estremocensis]|uniref:Uncharacterized protein n=1 Tax=Dactylonectria estremocensis TaxID=1079267 RepID=A0A9P9ISV1_9HYPO|nr:hypothetical protein B0J13DRAFT_132401 [Dactylonectria estremocensis]
MSLPESRTLLPPTPSVRSVNGPSCDEDNEGNLTRSDTPLALVTPASKGWKPRSLSIPVLSAVIALTLILATIIEILAQRGQARKGLAKAPTLNELPQYATISYRYVPNIVAVLFSLLWNWIDLDVKRIQPWTELSKPGGVTAQNSILLDYPSDFIAVAPVRAAKRRHWAVFLSGSIMVLVFWVLTPLQTALFGTSVATHTQLVTVTQRSELLPLDKQFQDLRFLHRAYAIGWMNNSYPAFTTPEYALLPYYVDDVAFSGQNKNWTSNTTKLWAEVDCSPVEYRNTGNKTSDGELVYRFSADDCFTDVNLDPNNAKALLYYRDSRYFDYVDAMNWNCSSQSDDHYSALVLWSQRMNTSSTNSQAFNITALQCHVSFHKQTVLATVTSVDLLPVDESTEVKSESRDLTSGEFNMTSYKESLPSYSVPTNTGSGMQDITDIKSPDFFIPDSGFSSSSSLFLQYGIVSYNESAELLSDPLRLERLVRGVHQRFFSLSIADRLRNNTDPADDACTSTFTMAGIVVSRILAVIVEILLVLIALATGFIGYHTRSSPCNLVGAPGSINHLIDIAHNSPMASKHFWFMDIADDKNLARNLRGYKFYLTIDPTSNQNELVISEGKPESSDEQRDLANSSYYTPVKPLALGRAAGCTFAVLIATGIGVLSYLKAKEGSLNGLTRPSSNFEVRQLLENFIPTVFATVVEPFWIFLTRTICIFQPFQDLWTGSSRPERSIKAEYTSVPPQMIFYRAFKGRHIMLALLCLVTLLANVLAVSLGALFNERLTTVDYPRFFKPVYQTHLNATNIGTYQIRWGFSNEFMFMLLANMTYDAQLIPWVSSEYYFQPHEITGSEGDDPNDTYVLRTMGLGANANCTSVAASSHVIKEQSTSSGGTSMCDDNIESLRDQLIHDALQKQSNAPAAAAYYKSLIFGGTLDPSVDCNPALTFCWARAPDGLKENETMTTSYSVCRPVLETAMFDVTVDRLGHVLDYQQIVRSQPALHYANLTSDARSFFMTLNNLLYPADSWSNSTNTLNWISQMIYLETGSRDFVNPKLPLPDLAKLTPVINKVYSRIVAAFFGRNTDFFDAVKQESMIEGKRITRETRIFMDNTAFVISMAVLGLDLAVALFFYLRATLYVLPRFPTTLGSVLAYIAPSRAVRDGTPSSGWKGQTFSFGRYMGHDGKGHIGIEMDPHVVAKDTSLGSRKSLFQPLLGGESAGENFSVQMQNLWKR